MNYFTLHTLGCKVNQYDGLSATELLQQAGWKPAPRGVAATCVIINTCCVTTVAMRKSRQAIRRAIRKNPHAMVCVIGCYTAYHESRLREMLAAMEIPATQILLASHHDNLAERLDTLIQSAQKTDTSAVSGEAVLEKNDENEASDEKTPATLIARRRRAVRAVAHDEMPNIQAVPGHQRAFVKVQDGCDAFCTYCIVPYTRAKLHSRSVEKIEAECKTLLAAGHREIVLCGVFLGAYGKPTAIRNRWNDPSPISPLPDLLRRIARLDGLWRVRLSSLEPGDVTDELLDVYTSEPTVAPHFHLPLQAGSAKILRKMNRQYTPDAFAETVARLRNTLDRPAITTDIIVGFPEETEEDFAATLALARQAEFAKIHAFPFSAIEPTVAWKRRRLAPPPPVVRERLARLAALETTLAEAYRLRFLGETVEALVESTRPHPGQQQALTDRYLTVVFNEPTTNTVGQVVPLHITATTQTGLAGELA